MSEFPNLIWIDMEMSGLDPDRETILEIASVITDSQLKVIEVGPEIVIHQDQSLFAKMDSWNQKQHSKSGLWTKVIESNTSIVEAEKLTLAFLKKHCEPGKSPLCGNTIYQDRKFISKLMPSIEEFLHYRLIDVSTIKELSLRWYPELLPSTKKNSHRALDDILESIEELKFYREKIFIKTDLGNIS